MVYKLSLAITLLAKEIFRQAALKGFPAYAEAKRPNYLKVETRNGTSFYRAIVLRDIEGEDFQLAIAFSTGYGEVVVGKLRGDALESMYPWMIPRAVALNIAMMSNVEADMWSKRIYWYLHDKMVLHVIIRGYEVYRNREWDCYTVRIPEHDILVGWYNKLLDRLYCSDTWIKRWADYVDEEKMQEACSILGSVGMRD